MDSTGFKLVCFAHLAPPERAASCIETSIQFLSSELTHRFLRTVPIIALVVRIMFFEHVLPTENRVRIPSGARKGKFKKMFEKCKEEGSY
jgi:hypothetical protein